MFTHLHAPRAASASPAQSSQSVVSVSASPPARRWPATRTRSSRARLLRSTTRPYSTLGKPCDPQRDGYHFIMNGLEYPDGSVINGNDFGPINITFSNGSTGVALFTDLAGGSVAHFLDSTHNQSGNFDDHGREHDLPSRDGHHRLTATSVISHPPCGYHHDDDDDDLPPTTTTTTVPPTTTTTTTLPRDHEPDDHHGAAPRRQPRPRCRRPRRHTTVPPTTTTTTTLPPETTTTTLAPTTTTAAPTTQPHRPRRPPPWCSPRCRCPRRPRRRSPRWPRRQPSTATRSCCLARVASPDG